MEVARRCLAFFSTRSALLLKGNLWKPACIFDLSEPLSWSNLDRLVGREVSTPASSPRALAFQSRGATIPGLPHATKAPPLSPWRRRLAYTLATWFGCGLTPGAPGTVGTLGAIPLYLALRPHGAPWIALVAILITGIGVWAATLVALDLDKKDPQIVVIDEVAGVLLTLLVAHSTWASLIAGVVLFRLFDQLKPWPARYAERSFPLGWGIVFDDVFAGIWGAVVLSLLQGIHWLP